MSRILPILDRLPDRQFVRQEIGALESYVNDTLKQLKKLFASSEDLEDVIQETVWNIDKKFVTKSTFEDFQKEASLKLMRMHETVNDHERRIVLL